MRPAFPVKKVFLLTCPNLGPVICALMEDNSMPYLVFPEFLLGNSPAYQFPK